MSHPPRIRTCRGRLRWSWLVAVAAAVAATTSCGGGDGGAAGTYHDPTVVAALGEKARDGQFEFAVTGVERGKTHVGYGSAGVAAEGEFVFIDVTAMNVGTGPRMVRTEHQKLGAADGVVYSAHTQATASVPGNAGLFGEVPPGAEVAGTLVFEIPDGTALARVELHDSADSGGVHVSLEIMAGWN